MWSSMGKKVYDQLIDLDIAVDLSRKRIRSRSRYNSTNRNLWAIKKDWC